MTKKKTNKVKLTQAQRNFREKAKFVEVQKKHLNDAAEMINSAYDSLDKSSIEVEPLRQAYELVIDVVVMLVDKYLTTPEERDKRTYEPPIEDTEPEE